MLALDATLPLGLALDATLPLGLALAAVPLALAVAPSAYAAEAPDPASHPVNRSLTTYNTHAAFRVPLLDGEQLTDLDQGEVVRIIERDSDPEKPARALAYRLSDHPMSALWVAALDPHLTVDPDLTERALAEKDGRELWYGYYELPYPISDRYWVIESWNNLGLAKATGNRAWEHAWELVPHRLGEARVAVASGRVPGIDAESMNGAVFTPDNHGAWAFVDVGDKRLILYHATSTIGGSIPDWIALRLVHSRLDALLDRIDARCDGLVQEHYTAEHPHLQAGDRSPLTWRP